MQLILISSPKDVADESQIINDLFAIGLTRFHLRKPDSSIAQVSALLDLIHPAFYHRIALHQHHGLAKAYGIKRLHFTEQVRKHTGENILTDHTSNGHQLSTSIHDVQNISVLSHFEYVFYGPIFNSLSKPGYQAVNRPNFQPGKLGALPRVIALGGIELSNLKTVQAMGFDGAGVLGTIWNHPDKAVQTFKRLQANVPV